MSGLSRLAHDPCDCIAPETALRKKPLLPCALEPVNRWPTKALIPDGKRTLTLCATKRINQWIGDRRLKMMGTQLMLNSPQSESARPTVRQTLRKTLLREQSAALEVVEQQNDLLLTFGMGRELSSQFEPTVLA